MFPTRGSAGTPGRSSIGDVNLRNAKPLPSAISKIAETVKYPLLSRQKAGNYGHLMSPARFSNTNNGVTPAMHFPDEVRTNTYPHSKRH